MRGLLEGKLKLIEAPMPYADRIGESKLLVARDGVRFLVSIVRAAAIHRPARPLLLSAFVFALGALLLGSQPLLHWLRHRAFEEWMTYRVLAAFLLGTATAILASAAVVAEQIAAIAHGRPAAHRGAPVSSAASSAAARCSCRAPCSSRWRWRCVGRASSST